MYDANQACDCARGMPEVLLEVASEAKKSL